MKKQETRNKARDVIGDYYKTNMQYEKENDEAVKTKGLTGKHRPFSKTEKVYIGIIVVGLIGILIKYVIL